jgi:hypothetical protein
MGRMKRELIERDDHGIEATRLIDLLHGRVGVHCWCNRCSHSAETPIGILVAQLGLDFPVPEIGTRMRCRSCGSKDVATRPAWQADVAERQAAAG